MRRSRIIPILLALLAPPAPAQPLAPSEQSPLRSIPRNVRPERASRVVALFDFEERRTNPLQVPEGWVRGQHEPAIGRERPGFPRFNRAELDYEAPALDGEGSVRLEANGGSASLLMRPGVVPIFPGADYMILASVRTRDLTHARAQIAARLLDQNLEPIPGSESRSQAVRSPQTWTRLRAPVLGDHPDAAYLQIELLLLQPEQLEPERSERAFAVTREDYQARAWFDEVGVVAMPRIEINPRSPGAVTVSPQRPTLDLLVRDLAGDPLTVDAVITDARGREVAHERHRLPGGRLEMSWTPQISQLGWYRATLEVRVAEVLVGAAETRFAWVPPRRRPDRVGAGPDARPSHLEDWEQFGLIVPRLRLDDLDALVPLIRASGAGAITLGVWGWTDDAPNQRALVNALGEPINEIIDDWVRLTLSFARVPESMASSENLEPHDVPALLAGDPSVWESSAVALLDRFGQRIRRWQIGLPQPGAPLEHTQLPDTLARIETALSAMIPGPIIDIPWHSDDLIVPDAVRWGRDLTLLSTPGDDIDAYALLKEDWDAARRLAPLPPDVDPSDRPGLTLAIEPLDPARYGPRVSAAEFVRHAVMFWSQFAPTYSPEGDAPDRATLALVNPWTTDNARRPAPAPTPALAALRATIDRLSGRRVTRTLDNHPGVRALLLEPVVGASAGAPGAIALWCEDRESTTFELFLGNTQITRVDIFGNHTPIEPELISDLEIPVHRIQLTREPIFLEGVDTTLVSFLASLRLSPDTLATTGDLHETFVNIENPWPVPIRGALFIVEPGGYASPDTEIDRSWRISPRKIAFRLDPGQSRQYPVSVAFSLAEEAGPKRLVMDAELIAERDHGIVRTEQPLIVGLPGIDLDVSVQRAKGADGVEFVAIDLIITNRRAQPISFDLVGVAPARPRERTTVVDLAPGEIAARTIAFEYAPDLHDARIAISLVLPADEGRLNKSITID